MRRVRRSAGRGATRAAFDRQAGAFARSPVQNDPARLRRLLTYADVAAGDKVLDVACGPGIVTRALDAARCRAVGIDDSAGMLRAAAPGLRLVRADAGRLPFADGTFEVALCRSAFHHFAAPGPVLREMARVVRPGGRVVVEDMRAPDDPARSAYHETIERLRDPSHARTLTRDELRSLAAFAGLAPVEDEPVTFVIDFDEWLERGGAPAEDRARARRMMEACLERDLCGLRVWTEEGHLKFERNSLMLRAGRPPR